MRLLLLALLALSTLSANYNLYERNLRDRRCGAGECRGYPNFNYNSPTYYPPPIADGDFSTEESEEVCLEEMPQEEKASGQQR